MKPSRLYICVPREKKGIIAVVRKYFNEHFHKVFSEWHRNGGGSGDLGEEVAQLDMYRIWNGAHLQLYTVLDHNTNGYAELLSVLLPEEATEPVEALITFLEGHDFVTSHTHLRERPFGFKCFEPYLDQWYIHQSKKPFHHQ